MSFDITPQKRKDYKDAYQRMTKKKNSLERSLKRNELDLRKQEQITYRIELINVIQGYMSVVIGDRRNVNNKCRNKIVKRL